MELPYRAEYAKSGRAKCKGCKEQIEQNTLRLAVMVQSPMFDGKVPNWYHFHCFFLKQRVKNVGDISHFESLRWEDQEKIQKKIGESSSSKVSNDSDSKKSKKSTKANKRKNNSLDDFIVEYSKSSRASCRGCEEKIVKQEVRAAKKDYDSEDARKYGGIPLWHHLECFSKLRNELEFWESGSELPGFKNLKKEDQENVMKLLPQIKPVKIKKEESDTVDGAKPAKQPKIEDNSIIKNQNKEIFKYRDQLIQLKKKELDLLMEYNGQDIAIGTETKLDRLSDAMVFGTLLPCKECKDGQLVFRSGVGYYCLGNKDEWVKCESVTLHPERKSFRIPKELKEKYSFLNAYKYKSQKRVMQNIAPSISVESVASTSYAIKSMMKSEPSTSPAGYDNEKRGKKSKIKIMFNRPKIQRFLPLKNMEFYAIGRKMPIEKEVLRCEILKLGGTLSSKMHSNITAVLATKEQVNSDSKILDKAEENGIQVVPFEFIEECKKPGSNAVSNINKMNLVSWGDDPTNRMESTVTHSKSKSISGKFKSNLPSKVKLKVKHGAAVDPDSGLEDVAQVYKFGKDIYNTTLSLTDLQSGRNSYYKLQVLESLDKKSYWLFRSWGRIGTTIGSTKLEKKGSREEAVEEFQALFEEKTGNMWSGRHNFRKIPLKMVMVDISYEDEKLSTAEGEVPSKLEKPVQNLISLIFNVDAMKNVMLEFELDLEKMPLGKLSKKQIQEAFKVLGSIQEFLSASDGISNVQTLVGFTNRFYTLIPHDFGIENPPLINTIEAIRQKSEMLDTLLELEIAYSILSNSESGKVMHHIDNYYLKLQADISVLDKSSPEFKTFELYVKNTHAETHRTYDLEIMDIFKVNRSGENKRYKPFKKIQNRQLLWHGSRTTNFAGIISQGLRIAPPEAPVTGYMFGKGIYFADMVSKSANYCMTNATNNVGLVLLCEVALGEMCECTRAETFVKPPKGKNSVKGVGMTEPDPKDTITREDGVQIPLGKGVRCEDRQTSLLYNEYIVYDVAQVKVEYLVQLKFNYK